MAGRSFFTAVLSFGVLATLALMAQAAPIYVSGDHATTISASGAGVEIRADGALNVKITDSTANALEAANGGVVNLSGYYTSIDVLSGTASTTGNAVYAGGGDSQVTLNGKIMVQNSAANTVRKAGLYAEDSGKIVMTGSDVYTSGELLYGIFAQSSADVSHAGNVYTNGENAVGVYANGATVSVGKDVRPTGDGAHGAVAENGGFVTVGRDVVTDGQNTFAAKADNATVVVGEGLLVKGQDSFGAFAANGGSVTVREEIGVAGTAERSYAAYAENSGTVTVELWDIRVNASDSFGAYAAAGGQVSTGRDIILHGSNSTAARAEGNGSSVYVKEGVLVGSSDSYGAYATANGVVRISEDVNLGSDSAGSRGAYAELGGEIYVDRSISVHSANSYGAYASNDGRITLNGSMNVSGSGATALHANGGVIEMNDGTLDFRSNTLAVAVENAGQVSLNNVTAGFSGAHLISADADGVVFASGSTLSGDTTHSALNAGTLVLALADGSTLSGAVNTLGANGRIDLTLNGANDAWYVTADSNIGGKLTNRGLVDFYGAGLTSGTRTVTVGSYAAADNAALRMRADLSTQTGDRLVIENQASGTSSIYVANTSSGSAYHTRSHALVTADNYDATGSDAAFTLANPDDYVDVGGRQYVLGSQKTGGAMEWFLESANKLAPSGRALAGGSVITPEIWYLEVDTLYKRIEIYQDTNYDGGVWFDGAAKKIEHDTYGNFGAFDQTLQTLSLGWDEKKATKSGVLYRGFMAGYGYDDRSFIDGIGDADMHSLQASFYAAHRRADGFYLAGLIKYNRYRNDVTARIADSYERLDGHLKQNGLGTSLIAGKRFDIKNGWYWEPTAQLSFFRVFANDYTANSGLHIDVRDGDSLRGKAGFVVGRKWTLKNGQTLDLFFDAAVLHEFDGETDVYADGYKLTADYGGTWGVFGVGTAWQLNKNSWLNARFYYGDGDSRREPWGVQLGMSIEM